MNPLPAPGISKNKAELTASTTEVRSDVIHDNSVVNSDVDTTILGESIENSLSGEQPEINVDDVKADTEDEFSKIEYKVYKYIYWMDRKNCSETEKHLENQLILSFEKNKIGDYDKLFSIYDAKTVGDREY